jgi:mannose-1-phosphate guanylyltransferase
MRAMILAAGLGTRLRPITDTRPKALVEVSGHTLLEITIHRLREFGIREVIINVHHFAQQIVEYLQKNDNFGMRIEISLEDILLDTGGGLKKAAWFFLEESNRGEPFLLYNVDVLSTIDFGRLFEFHRDRGALATLAVQERETSRYLLFDKNNLFCGRKTGHDGKVEMARPVTEAKPEAFCGVHVISPRLLSRITEEGVFSIVACYMRLAGEGEKILGFSADHYYWRDLGKAENIAQAERDAERRLVSL